jgi:hypothetical protein
MPLGIRQYRLLHPVDHGQRVAPAGFRALSPEGVVAIVPLEYQVVNGITLKFRGFTVRVFRENYKVSPYLEVFRQHV